MIAESVRQGSAIASPNPSSIHLIPDFTFEFSILIFMILSYSLFRLIVITNKSAIIARKPSNPPVFSDGIIVLVSVGTAFMVRVGLAAGVSV